jgi:signal transduction histidine kinase
VLINVIGNAVKFTEEGEIHVAARCASDPARSGHDLIQYAIRDTGIGITADSREKIFEMFTQVKTPDAISSGCGLGLAISKQIVENMGGKIWVESKMGAGSTFTFTMILDDAGRNQQDGETTRLGNSPPISDEPFSGAGH